MESGKREKFSKIGFVLAAAGSAVGLGNIWKFPTLAGQNGGGIFLIFYLVFIVLMGVPLILGEASMGRYAQLGPTGAYQKIASECGKKGLALKFWTVIGALGSFANLIVLMYYSVIAGWVLQYCIRVFDTPIQTMDMDLFGEITSQPVVPIIFALIIIWLTVMVDMKGIAAGVERVSKILMPLLFIMLIFCAIFSMTLDGAMEGVKYMWVPSLENAENVGGLGHVALAALGQCFFSLSLGCGMMITFGSFVSKKSSLPKQVYGIPILDTVVALLAGFVTLPAVFAVASQTGIDPTSQTGPGMLMYALPQSLYAAFGSGLGTVLTFVMLLLVVFAAFTSTVAILQATVSHLIEYMHMDKKKAYILCGIVVSIGSIICSLSNGSVLSGLTIGGMCIQDAADWFVSNLLMPIGAFFMCIFVGYIWKMDNSIKEITNDGSDKFTWAGLFKVCIMVIDPIIILIVFLSGIGVF